MLTFVDPSIFGNADSIREMNDFFSGQTDVAKNGPLEIWCEDVLFLGILVNLRRHMCEHSEQQFEMIIRVSAGQGRIQSNELLKF